MSDELAGLLAAGERAAFHGRPAAGIAPLTEAVDLAGLSDRPDEATAATWLLGVSLGAAGRYGSALKALRPLTDDERRTGPAQRLFASLSASTQASVHRQLGLHAAARALDERAVGFADDAPDALFDARLGLAADAVGLGDEMAARTELSNATTYIEGRSDWWRQRVRLLWVRTEISLLTDDPVAAAKSADTAVMLAEGSGAPRHVAKSLLFLGVAQVQSNDVSEAPSTLRRAATLAESLGCLPLVWPSRAVLGALLQGDAPQESARNLAGARSTVLAIADDLDEELRAGWLARSDIAALLEG